MSVRAMRIFTNVKNSLSNLVYSISEVYKLHKGFLIVVLLTALLMSGAKVWITYFVKILSESLEKMENIKFYNLLIILSIIFIVAGILNTLFVNILLPKINNKIEVGLKKKIYKIYSKIDNYNEYKKYDLYFYTINNIYVIPEITTQLGMFVNSMFAIGGLLVLFSKYDLSMILVIFFGALFSFLANMYMSKIQYNISIENIPYSRKIDYINRLFYVPDYMKEIKLLNKNLFFDSLEQSYDNLLKIYFSKVKLISFLAFSSKVLSELIIVIILLILGKNVINGKYSIAVFLMLFSGSQQILSDLNNIFSSFPKIYSLSLKIGKIKEFIDLDKSNDNLVKVNEINKIELKNLTYNYDGQKNIFQNVNLTLKKEDGIVVLQGDNGSGKSTLINMLLGFIKAREGVININGVNINNIENKSYFEKISVVFQDFKIFSFSIYENIVGKSEIIEEKEKMVIEILKEIGIYDKISKFEKGIHTVFSDEFEKQNGGFSKGELQKLSFARAIIHDGDLFIMDEPDSFADSNYRKKIGELILKYKKDKIVLIITHNKELLNIANKIYKIENNNIIEIKN